MLKTISVLLASSLSCVVLFAQAQKDRDPANTQTTPKGQQQNTTKGDVSADQRSFLQQSAESGYNEVRMAQLAASRASNPQVKDFANMLIRDHTKANEEIHDLARKNNVDLPEYISSADQPGAPNAAQGKQKGTQAEDREANPGDRSAKAGDNTGGNNSGKAGGNTAAKAGDNNTRKGQAERSAKGGDSKAEEDYSELARLNGDAFDRRYVDLQVTAHRTAISRFENVQRTGQNQEIRQFAQNTLPTLRTHMQRAETLQRQLRDNK